jgi:hypothetical protein
MSKKIDLRLTIEEMKKITAALASFGGSGSSLIEKIEEIIEDNEEPHELTREEWNEKYGRMDD